MHCIKVLSSFVFNNPLINSTFMILLEFIQLKLYIALDFLLLFNNIWNYFIIGWQRPFENAHKSLMRKCILFLSI